eukprot:TRINITY_DN7024_c0_g1_i2.p2 TRINITY_DN7024_c0_g1~~TRINITY_DN7024_c0_g1_i2.p2  ORF type:complete len:257 (-),score=38.02 TRINITY_DN7024_c0_g1_i2:1491-2261(-)
MNMEKREASGEDVIGKRAAKVDAIVVTTIANFADSPIKATSAVPENAEAEVKKKHKKRAPRRKKKAGKAPEAQPEAKAKPPSCAEREPARDMHQPVDNRPAKRLSVPLYRFWNARTSDHFYTTNRYKNTKKGDTGQVDSIREGVVANVFTEPQPYTVPMHSYYDKKNCDHFYTTERLEHKPSAGFEYGSVIGWVYSDPAHCSDENAVALHCYWNAETRDHLYTSTPEEVGTEVLGEVGKNGYRYEGIVMYLPPASP